MGDGSGTAFLMEGLSSHTYCLVAKGFLFGSVPAFYIGMNEYESKDILLKRRMI